MDTFDCQQPEPPIYWGANYHVGPFATSCQSIRQCPIDGVAARGRDRQQLQRIAKNCFSKQRGESGI